MNGQVESKFDPMRMEYHVVIPASVLERQGIPCRFSQYHTLLPAKALDVAIEQANALHRDRHKAETEVRAMIKRNNRRRFGP